MNTSKIFILIVILIAIGIVALVINYSKQPLSVTQPIRLPKKGEKLEAVEMVEIEKIKKEIRTEAKGEIIKYQEESFYSEGDFSAILENQNEFKSQLIERFKKEIIRVTAENCRVDLNDSEKSAILKCDIREAMYASSKYNMHFLLGNWPFDLYQFKKYEKKLIYDGEIDGISTNIVFEFPYILSHCHEHVWPK